MKEREVTQIQLEQQSSFLRSFLDASPDLVFYRNEDKEFSGCNRAMELLTGKSEKQLIHLKPQDVYSEEAAAKVMETDEKVFRHNVSLTYEQWLDYPDGRKACFEIRKVPYYDRVGKRHGLMGFGRDITERKRYQDALERASRDKTTFISTIRSSSESDRPDLVAPSASAGSRVSVYRVSLFPDVVMKPSPMRPASRVAAGPEAPIQIGTGMGGLS